MSGKLITEQARVKEFLHYDEMTGLFTWKKRPVGWIKIGSIAGWLGTRGYWIIGLDGRKFAAHRLVWLYVHGVMPPAEIDHINGIPTDNRFANLRLATRTENLRNSRLRKSVSGLKGAHFEKRRQAAGLSPWSSGIKKNGKRAFLGYFTTAEEAHAAYVKAATELFGQFARAA